MARIGRSFALGFVAALLLVGVFLGGYLLGNGKARSVAVQTSGFDLLWRVHDLLQANFYGDIPETREQAYGAVRGLTEAYKDPYTVFVEPAAREVERDELTGPLWGNWCSVRPRRCWRHDADSDSGSPSRSCGRHGWRRAGGGRRTDDNRADERRGCRSSYPR